MDFSLISDFKEKPFLRFLADRRRLIRLFRWVVMVLVLIPVLSACSNPEGEALPSTVPGGTMTTTSTTLLDNLDVETIYQNPDFVFKHVGESDGLLQGEILTGMQDRFGFLWFGTRDGLNRYDGVEFVTLRNQPDDLNSLSSSIILSLLEDQTSQIFWIGTSAGLTRYDPAQSRFDIYRHDETDISTLSGDEILVLFQDSRSRIWIGSDAGLDRFSPSTRRITRMKAPPVNLESLTTPVAFNDIFEDADGILWLGTSRGLFFFDPESLTYQDLYPEFEPFFRSERLAVNSLHEDQDGNVWVGTAAGLLRWNSETHEIQQYQNHQDRPVSLSDNTINDVFQDRLGLIWVATDSGLNLYNRLSDGFIRFEADPTQPASISSNQVLEIFQDRSGLLWFLTSKGINSLDLSLNRFQSYRFERPEGNIIGTDLVYAIQQDYASNLWMGTANGLLRYNLIQEEFTRFAFDPLDENSLSNNTVTSILMDQNMRLWVGTSEGGVDWMDPVGGGFYHLPNDPREDNALSSKLVSIMMEDRQGSLWIGYAAGRLDRLDANRDLVDRYVLQTTDPERQRRNRVRALLEDNNGILWVGTAYGIYQIEPVTGQIRRFTSDPENLNSLSIDYITCFYQSQAGTIWIGTYGGGLNRYNAETDSFTHYRIRDGLPSDMILGILEDSLGNLWMSTAQGLVSFNPQSNVFRTYDVSDGLLSSQFNENAYFRSPAGVMYFGGDAGVTSFIPENIGDNPYKPPVVLTLLRTGERTINPFQAMQSSRPLVLGWPDNSFEFEFSVLNYRQAEKNHYAYRLEGFESDWNTTDNRRYGRYTNLPGGEYTLRLVGANDDEVWNETGVAIRIRVVPPFWETTWFQVGAILLIMAMIGGGYLLKMRSVEANNRMLAIQVRERTREIEQRRQVAEGLREVFILLNQNRSLEESLAFIQNQVVRLADAKTAQIIQLIQTTGRGTVMIPEVFPSGERLIAQEVVDWYAREIQAQKQRFVSDWHEITRENPALKNPKMNWARTVVCIPIIPEGEIFGALLVFYPQVRRFSQEENGLLDSFAEQAALAVGNAQLRAKTEEIAVLSERSRLARDLHDAVTQTLFSATLIAEAIPHSWANNPEEAQRLIQELRSLNRGALAEMRSLLMELRPAAVVEARLSDLLRQLAEAISGRTGLQVNLSLDEECSLPRDIHIGFYRIAQEALTNVVKHARASELGLTLRCEPVIHRATEESDWVKVTLIVEDNGRGFQPQGVPTNHFGLANIKERAEAIQAQLEIFSEPARGTRITLIWEGEESIDE